MKSFLLTTLAAALVVPTMAAPALAKDNRPDNHGREVSRVANHHQFKRGEKFDRRYASNYREINYRGYKSLKAPPRGYHWVRSGNDALLVAISSGVIASIVAGTFH
jgi:Ni/Co efflux regulator RcnB